MKIFKNEIWFYSLHRKKRLWSYPVLKFKARIDPPNLQLTVQFAEPYRIINVKALINIFSIRKKA